MSRTSSPLGVVSKESLTCVQNFSDYYLKVNRKFTLSKTLWDSVALDRIEAATDPSKSADVAAVVMQEGLAHLCLVSSCMTLVRAKIDVQIPRKRRGQTSQHDKALVRFYDQILQVRQLITFKYSTVDSAYSGHLGTGLKWPQ